MSAALSPDSILRDLAALWTATGGDAHAETGAGVLRACAMTLVTTTTRSTRRRIECSGKSNHAVSGRQRNGRIATR